MTYAPSLIRVFQPQAISGAMALALTLWLGSPTLAQNAPDASPDALAESYIQFTPSSVGNAPGGRARGGASRGECPAVAQPLTAIVPTIDNRVGGLTTSEHPAFWFYVPYALTADRPAEFVLLDEQDRSVYQTMLMSTPSASGMVRVELPATVALAEGKLYRWIFMINCEIDNPIFTRGSVQRIPLSDSGLPNPMTQAEPIEQARLYATNGIWFDALDTLANLKKANPNNEAIDAEWQSLLRSVNLADVADKPFAH